MEKKKEFNPKVQWAKFIVVRTHTLFTLSLLGKELVGTACHTFYLRHLHHEEDQMAVVEGG